MKRAAKILDFYTNQVPGFTPETHNHIMKHGIKRFEVEEVFNHEFISRKVHVENETR